MKKNLGAASAILSCALLGLSLAPKAEAQAARTRDILVLQEDIYQLDDTMAQLTPRQQARFQPRIDALRTDVTNLRARMDPRETWQTRVTRAELDAMRTRVTTLQQDIDRAETRTASQPARPRYGREIPSGTELHVTLDQTISSKSATLEQRIEATTVTAVMLDGRTVVPAGTTVTGHVAEVDDPDRANRDGRVRLEFTGLQFPNGQRADIRSTVVQVEDKHTGSSTTKRAGIGAILGGVLGGLIDGGSGAVIGAVLGGGGAVVATKGQHVELPQGSHLVLRLDQPTVLAQR